MFLSRAVVRGLACQIDQCHTISNPGIVDLPFVLEHVALGVLGLEAETLRAVRDIGESNGGIF